MRLLAGSLAGLAIALCTSGCGSSATLDPVAKAADATSHLGGVHMSLSMQLNGIGASGPVTVSGQGSFNYKTQEGTLSLDMSGLPANASVPTGALHMQELFKSSAIYLNSPLLASKLPGGASWMKFDLRRVAQAVGFDPQQLMGGQANPAQFLEYLRGSGGAVTTLGRDNVRGVPTMHYRAAIDLNKVADRLPASKREQLHAALSKVIAQIGTSSIPVEVWVDDHKLVRRLTMGLSIPAGPQRIQMSMVVELFGFGPTPAVTPPPAAEVFDATKTALSGFGSNGG
jgi:hypothetical protein